MKIIFLGTSSMLPTKDRNPTAILLNYKAENILIDCGEGTQRQFRFAKIKPTKITKILITHWHGDHILGLPGLIQSLGANNYNKLLEIYGPKGTKNYFSNMLKSFNFPVRIKIKITEITETGTFYKNKDFELSAIPLNHDIPTLAYSFKEKDKLKIKLDYTKKLGLTNHPLLGKLQKGQDITYKNKKIKVKDATTLIKGKKVTFILDTAMCKNAIKIAKNSDLLICEATWAEELKEKIADYKHLIASDAARIAKKSKSKQLVLTHFSQRYKNVQALQKEAKKIFKNTKTAKDFMEITI